MVCRPFVKAVVIKDGTTPSRVVTQTYDVVNKKPARPLMTLAPGNYIRKIGDEIGFSTKFMPVPTGTEIYYTISYDGTFTADPIPGTAGTSKFDFDSEPIVPIIVKGHTIIKAVAVNVFGVKSDVGIFEYIVTPEAPKAAPSAVTGGDKLPIVPVRAVKGCTVKYDVNGIKNEFVCEDGSFYIDTANGNAYKDEACTEHLGTQSTGTITAPAELDISAELDGIESDRNRYTYKLSSDTGTLAPPYADKETGEYEEIKADENNNLLLIKLYSLNKGDTIQYTTDNGANWIDCTDIIKIKNDTVLQIRSEKNGNYSKITSYVYNFVPLAPIITLQSGRYLASENQFTMIELDGRAPTDKDYTIWYRENGGKQDVIYQNQKRYIDHTMSFKAYVKNNETGRVSKNTINYYIIEPEGAATGTGEYSDIVNAKTDSESTQGGTGGGGGGSTGGGSIGGGGGGSTGGSGYTPSTPNNPTTPSSGETFTDLENHAWAKDAVYTLKNKGIISGISDTEFAPANNIKRGDFILILTRMLSVNNEFTENFADVPESAYYYRAIGSAKAAGIAQGSGENFMPENSITRQDLITLAYRAFLAKGYITETDDFTSLDAFADKGDISD